MFSPSNPIRFYLSYNLRYLHRLSKDLLHKVIFAESRSDKFFSNLIIEHRSPILRNLKGVDLSLQKNKKKNLEIVIPLINGLIIEPGQYFSFWHLCGEPTPNRGFLPGLVIKSGQPAVGVGGGLCQFSNALFWSFLHTDLQVTERHRHSFDLFPDDKRQVPFGLGAGVAFGIKDLRAYNSTKLTYQINVFIENEELVLKILSQDVQSQSYQVEEVDSEFYRKLQDGSMKLFRRNTVIRKSYNGSTLKSDILFKNDFECKYDVDSSKIRKDS